MIFFIRFRKLRSFFSVSGRTYYPSDTRKQFAKYILAFLLISSLHVAVVAWADNKSIFDSIWLTLSTASTVGYGDIYSTSVWARLATIVFMYFCGIFILAQCAGLYFETTAEKHRKILQGEWRYSMKDHVIFLNVPKQNPNNFLSVVITALKKTTKFQDSKFLLITPDFPNGLSDKLLKHGAVLYNGRPDDPSMLDQINAKDASAIIILCQDENDLASDSVSFNILAMLQERGNTTHTVVEYINDLNRDRLKKAGADTVIRPLRAYPEMLVRSLEAPGSEIIIEEIFESQGKNDFVRVDVVFKSTWHALSHAILEKDLGVPLGYIDAEDGSLKVSPKGSERVHGKSLFILAADPKHVDVAAITALLSA